MASFVTSMPKVTSRSPNRHQGQTEEEMLAEANRRQMDDSASSIGGASSTTASSEGGGRRRRRRNRNKQVTVKSNLAPLGPPPVIPRMSESKPVRLQLGLNLDAELELKARLQGDVCISLVIQKKFTTRESTELKPNFRGVVDVEEMFHMRVGKLRFRKTWLDHDVSPSLTAAVMFGIAVSGFAAGFAASRWVDTWLLPIPFPV